jgi:hypothetical protein
MTYLEQHGACESLELEALQAEVGQCEGRVEAVLL